MQTLPGEFTEKYAILKDVCEKLLSITKEVGHEQLTETVIHLKDRLESPFTFVIVGEVKAGKSSFINALLDTEEEICRVAPSPMTDTIQQLVFGEEEKTEKISPYLKKMYIPEPALKEICIVDTPGTNTIISHHQEITETFIPYSDLIVFVFEAKNPYRQSSWDFLNFIHEEWHRKIVFVLQQKDLLPEADLLINVKGVEKYALEKGIHQPVIFAVSAKQEQEGQKAISGFQDIRLFLDKHITGGKSYTLKLQNNILTLRTITDKLKHSMEIRIRQYMVDEQFRQDIADLIEVQHHKTQRLIDALAENLLESYDNITYKKQQDLAHGLSLSSVIRRSLSAVWGKEAGLKEWLNHQARDFQLKLHTTLKDKLNNGIIDVADNIQSMGKLVAEKLKNSETILKNNDDIFSDIAERRIHVLRDLQENFSSFMNNSENFYDQSMMEDSSKMTPQLAAGSGIAVVGVMIATLAQGVVFDITGGILTTVGVLFAGITLGLNKNKVMKKFNTEIQTGRIRMKTEVTDKLNDYSRRIKVRLESNFIEFDKMLEIEKNIIDSLQKSQTEIEESLKKAEN